MAARRATPATSKSRRTKVAHPEPEPLFNLGSALSELQPEYIQCRDFGHSWRPFSARWIAADNCYESLLRCGRCGTERVRYLGPRGQLMGSHYDYADGYLMLGAGRMTTSDRDQVRFASIQSVLVKDTVRE